MSAIVGVFALDGAPVGTAAVTAMLAAMPHRGPDGVATWDGGAIALGQATRHTTPESLGEALPLQSEDGALTLVMAGRVDNADALRSSLATQGARLRTRGDGALILSAYETWGRDCVHHIDGDFAFALYDGRSRTLFCARDRLGWAPFTYSLKGNLLAFASEPRALLELPTINAAPNERFVAGMIAETLTHQEDTLWEGIVQIPPAHTLVVADGKPTVARYWMPDLTQVAPYKGPGEAAESLRAVLTDSVRRVSRCHKPLACEVSGGLDSSTVFALATKLGDELSAPGITGYTLAFGDGSDADEAHHASAVGTHVGNPVHSVAPFRADLRWHEAYASKHASFAPYPNLSMLSSIYTAAREAGSVAVLTGQGGDQWLTAGRESYAEAFAARNAPALSKLFASDREAYGTLRTLYWTLRHGLYGVLPEPIRRTIRALFPRLAAKGAGAADVLSPRLAHFARHRQRDRTGATLSAVRARRAAPLFSAEASFQNSEMERFAAVHGVELRSPLFTNSVVEWSISNLGALLAWAGDERALHRLTIDGLVPGTVRDREDKADFTTAFDWYRADLSARFAKAPSEDVARWTRPGWRTSDALRSLRAECADHWVLWTIFGCDAAVNAPRHIKMGH
ncbi:MAG: asparagine synthase-related protein [Pseudomonadota bacterium]